jgi:hypothetical protein
MPVSAANIQNEITRRSSSLLVTSAGVGGFCISVESINLNLELTFPNQLHVRRIGGDAQLEQKNQDQDQDSYSKNHRET